MASGIGVPAGELTLEHLDDLDRAAYALGYASAAVMLCPDLVYDERRAATVAIRERYDPALTYGVSADPAEGAAQIGDRKLYCAELFNRFGDNGTLIRGLLRAKSAPALR